MITKSGFCMRRRKDHSLRADLNNSICILLCNLQSIIFAIQFWWFVVSKALLKSRKMPKIHSSSRRAFEIQSIDSIIAINVQSPFPKLNCMLYMISFSFTNSVVRPYTNLSNILENTGGQRQVTTIDKIHRFSSHEQRYDLSYFK